MRGTELCDLGSRNGVFVNGTRLTTEGAQLLRDGDRIQTGDTTLLFQELEHESLVRDLLPILDPGQSSDDLEALEESWETLD